MSGVWVSRIVGSSGISESTSSAVRFRYACSAMPTFGCPARSLRYSSIVGSTYGADGETTGESPDFFYDSMVASGVFFGVYEGPDLIAAAGTHLFAPDEHAAAIGNVYTRRDRRGRGLSRSVTKAVLHRLRHLKTVGLNVREDNAAAIHVYESLGFVKHCDFKEALASPRV